MKLQVNGEPQEIADGSTVAQLIVAQTGSLRGSAAVVDGEVVPRSAWDTIRLTDGQAVEVITAVQGG
jgi:sulfur carrier protein